MSPGIVVRGPLVVLACAAITLSGYGCVHHRAPNLDGTIRISVAEGVLEGVAEASGVKSFKGIPFAEPPVGPLRWKAPQPAPPWAGVRAAADFGPRCPQAGRGHIFRSTSSSEDCLYLNVWSPTEAQGGLAPVMVYFHGGGFATGDGSEPRHDGEALARKGLVVVTCNFRLGVFGFLAHPDLSAESPYHASGNYGLLDQVAVLRWVERNIAAFGGDRNRVTIAGNSSGSAAVTGLTVSPLSRGLIAGAIGSAGALLAPVWFARTLEEAEQHGSEYAGGRSVAELRALPADTLREVSGWGQALPVIDGYFLTAPVADAFARGEQAHVPLLIGMSSREDANFVDITWRWADLHASSGEKPVYRYLFSHTPPLRLEDSVAAEDGWSINRINSEIEIQADGTLQVVETLDVDFGESGRRSFERQFSRRALFDDQYQREYQIDLADGAPAAARPYELRAFVTTVRRTFVFSDPRGPFKGAHTFRVAYSVGGALDSFPGHDELRWNATGLWSVPVRETSVSLRARPGDIAESRCFQGLVDSVESCQAGLDADGAAYHSTRAYAAGEQMTIVANLKKGAFTEPRPRLVRPSRPSVHTDDMDYAMGNARWQTEGQWTRVDEAVTQMLQNAYVNFVTSGDPNGPGLPRWPAAPSGVPQALLMNINQSPVVEPTPVRRR